MTTAWGGTHPEGRHGGDSLQYLLAAACGVLAGWIDVKVGDLLFTALIVLASCMGLGFARPRKPWRWVALVGIFVPMMEWLAYSVLAQKPACPTQCGDLDRSSTRLVAPARRWP